MSKNNFSRTNVDVQQMEVSAPSRSSFDLSKRDKFTLGFGKLIPLRAVNIMANSTFKGSVKPELSLENFGTPAAGPMRLDTHSFIVPARRVNKDYKRFQESAINGSPMSLPSFNLGDVVRAILNIYCGPSSGTTEHSSIGYLINANKVTSTYNPNDAMKKIVASAATRLSSLIVSTTDHLGYMQDFLAIEKERLTEVQHAWTSGQDYFLGDVVYDLCKPYVGEASILDNLGYDVITYFGEVRERLNKVDKDLRLAAFGSSGTYSSTTWSNYIQLITNGGNATKMNTFVTMTYDATQTNPVFSAFTAPEQCEMQLRAAYACWFDWFRNYHIEKVGDVLYPDDFTNTGIIKSFSFTDMGACLQLLAPHARNYTRDMFTMVQPDAVYRHVYAPASATQGVSTVENNSVPSAAVYDFEKIMTMVNDTLTDVFFPANDFVKSAPSAANFPTLYHDLQTMRRANMLENYLRKNFYNSDTFAGQIEAHYGVKPSDYSILVSQYIGGSESMINGEQHISANNIENSAGESITNAGQRTLVANVSSTDSFSYMCSDASYLINFASIVPIVSYDARNPFLHELHINEQPLPEFAADNRITIRTCDLLRDFNDSQSTLLGYVPKYYGYRHALDAVHGKYLREYRLYDWIRDRYASTPLGFSNVGGVKNNLLTINAYSQHINLAPDCFLGLKPWNEIAYGKIELPLFVECPLAGKVEFI